jgi:hypothetical protein
MYSEYLVYTGTVSITGKQQGMEQGQSIMSIEEKEIWNNFKNKIYCISYNDEF